MPKKYPPEFKRDVVTVARRGDLSVPVPKLEEWMEHPRGKIRAYKAHEKLVALGYAGSERTTRRAVAQVRLEFKAGRVRVHRPCVSEPGRWLQYDFGDGPRVDGVKTVLFCAWLAWSRFRVVLALRDKTAPSVFAALDVTLRQPRAVASITRVAVNGAHRFRWHLALLAVLLLSLPGCSAGGSDDEAANRDPAEVALFDGSSLSGWLHAGPGHFELRDGVLQTHGGTGLLWFARQSFGDFELRLDWRTSDRTDNSGVFLRFPDPQDDPGVAIEHGYEVQINDDPSRDPQTTGAIYGFHAPSSSASRPPGEWNSYRIRVTGREYTVWLNDVLVNRFVSTDSRRGLEGYLGLQNHDPDSTVDFRAIWVQPLS